MQKSGWGAMPSSRSRTGLAWASSGATDAQRYLRRLGVAVTQIDRVEEIILADQTRIERPLEDGRQLSRNRLDPVDVRLVGHAHPPQLSRDAVAQSGRGGDRNGLEAGRRRGQEPDRERTKLGGLDLDVLAEMVAREARVHLQLQRFQREGDKPDREALAPSDERTGEVDRPAFGEIVAIEVGLPQHDRRALAQALEGRARGRGRNLRRRRHRAGAAAEIAHARSIGLNLMGQEGDLVRPEADLAGLLALRRDGRADRLEHVVQAAHDLVDGVHLRHVDLRTLAHALDRCGNLPGCPLGLLRQRLDLAGDDAEAGARGPRPRGLDRRVEREKVRLRGDRRNELDGPVDLADRRDQFLDAPERRTRAGMRPLDALEGSGQTLLDKIALALQPAHRSGELVGSRSRQFGRAVELGRKSGHLADDPDGIVQEPAEGEIGLVGLADPGEQVRLRGTPRLAGVENVRGRAGRAAVLRCDHRRDLEVSCCGPAPEHLVFCCDDAAIKRIQSLSRR